MKPPRVRKLALGVPKDKEAALKFPKDRKAALAAMAQQGRIIGKWSDTRIAARLRVKADAVRMERTKLGIPRVQNPTIPPSIREQIISLIKKGENNNRIAEIINRERKEMWESVQPGHRLKRSPLTISRDSVRQIRLNLEGLPKQKRAEPAKATGNAAQSEANASAIALRELAKREVPKPSRDEQFLDNLISEWNGLSPEQKKLVQFADQARQEWKKALQNSIVLRENQSVTEANKASARAEQFRGKFELNIRGLRRLPKESD